MSPSPEKGQLVVVSNRLPELRGDGEASPRNVGGLVSALLPAVEAAGEAAWFGWSGAASRTKRVRVETRAAGGLTTHAISFPEWMLEGYYNQFCNGGLWPLLHSFPGRFSVDADDYRAYRHVNAAFAKALIRRIGANDRVWIHDFHLIPLGHELRKLGFPGRIGFFLHVPFPPAEIFCVMPWAQELLHAFGAYDLVGFHTTEYAKNFRRTLGREGLRRKDLTTGVYPIGIDPRPYEEWSSELASVRRGKELREGLRGRKLVLGVDRLDYTKGIPERLRIFGRFLELYPRWRRRVSFIQISAPSRTRVAEYVRQRRDVEELVGNVNGQYGDTEWVPVRYLFRSYGQRELAAFYRESDVGLVTPLRDGMNLVAKEYVAAQTGDPGVLVLSRFAGAANELTDAVLVNPYDIEGSAHALAAALEMPLEERVGRQRALLAKVRSQDAAAWARSFVGDLESRDPLRRGEHVRRRVAHVFEGEL